MSDVCGTCDEHEHNAIFMDFEDLMHDYGYNAAEFVAEAAKFALAYESALDESFLCIDCVRHTGKIGEYYSLNDDVWEQANPDIEGMLCIGCLEDRLGRCLTKEDFMDCPLNTEPDWHRSALLKERLGHV